MKKFLMLFMIFIAISSFGFAEVDSTVTPGEVGLIIESTEPSSKVKIGFTTETTDLINTFATTRGFIDTDWTTSAYFPTEANEITLTDVDGSKQTFMNDTLKVWALVRNHAGSLKLYGDPIKPTVSSGNPTVTHIPYKVESRDNGGSSQPILEVTDSSILADAGVELAKVTIKSPSTITPIIRFLKITADAGKPLASTHTYKGTLKAAWVIE